MQQKAPDKKLSSFWLEVFKYTPKFNYRKYGLATYQMLYLMKLQNFAAVQLLFKDSIKYFIFTNIHMEKQYSMIVMVKIWRSGSEARLPVFPPGSMAYWLSYAGQLLWASMRIIIVRTKLHVKHMALCLEHRKAQYMVDSNSYYITCDFKKWLSWLINGALISVVSSW